MPRDTDSDSDSDDDCFGDVGFMFDGALEKARRVFCFGDISVAVRLVDADPGAVQSGHYVWPAAPALSAFLVDQWRSLPTGEVLELGAGCGLGGLVAAQLPGTTAVILTDHDPGVLEIIGESIAEQVQATDLGWRAAAAKSQCVQLRWGRIGETQRGTLAMALASIGCFSPSNGTVGREEDDVIGGEGNCVVPVAGSRRTDARQGREADDVSFDIVIGSDVIYSATVVEPLFSTVDDLLSRGLTPRQPEPVSVAAECRRDRGREKEKPSGNAAAAAGGAAGTADPPSSIPRRPCRGPDSAEVCRTGDALGEGDRENTVAMMTAPPVFIMCQSFAYDSDTEEAIDLACSEHGLERDIVWDDLNFAPTTAKTHQDGGEVFVEIEKGRGITGRGSHACDSGGGELEDGGLDKPVDGRRSAATGGGGILSESTRAGTKLQLFRRSM